MKKLYRVKTCIGCPVCGDVVKVKWQIHPRRTWMAKSDPTHEHEFLWFTFEPPEDKGIGQEE